MRTRVPWPGAVVTVSVPCIASARAWSVANPNDSAENSRFASKPTPWSLTVRETVSLPASRCSVACSVSACLKTLNKSSRAAWKQKSASAGGNGVVVFSCTSTSMP